MRLDKYLVNRNIASRSVIKEYLKKGRVTVNGTTVKKPELQINEYHDEITFDGMLLFYEKYTYYMMNKPMGVVSATKDNTCTTVMELLEVDKKNELFLVGRLDKDTEGFMLITNDGDLSHNLLSPKKHVEKKYYLTTISNITDQDIQKLEAGLDIGEDKLTKPAKIERINEKELYISITEGKFHQIKRMLMAVGNQVVYLKRISLGKLLLDPKLMPGEYRKLTKEEIALLQES